MSYYDRAPVWHRWVDNGLDHLSRLGVLALVVLAWATTLAWPPPPAGTRPLVAGQQGVTSNSGYPLRIRLPDLEPIPMEELAALVQNNQQLARMDIGLPATDARQPGRSIGTGFVAAFASLLEPSDTRSSAMTTPAKPAPQLKPGEMLAVDYDLAKLTPKAVPVDAQAGTKPRFDARDGSLTVNKPLLVDGQNRGSATIRIEEGAQILIATSSVADALGPRAETLPKRIASALATRTGFIAFNDLRGAGIAVEYDPVKDRVSLSTSS